MDVGRRGFLTGLGKMVAGALAISILPQTPKQEVPAKPVLQRIVMAPGTTIHNCDFTVSPDFQIESGGDGCLIQDCVFDFARRYSG